MSVLMDCSAWPAPWEGEMKTANTSFTGSKHALRAYMPTVQTIFGGLRGCEGNVRCSDSWQRDCPTICIPSVACKNRILVSNIKTARPSGPKRSSAVLPGTARLPAHCRQRTSAPCNAAKTSMYTG